MLRLPPPRALCAFCLVLLFLLPTLSKLQGQSTTGVIGGTVYDPQHAVVPNARIVALNEATGAEFIAYSDKSGNYTLADLPPGTYSVDISWRCVHGIYSDTCCGRIGQTHSAETTLRSWRHVQHDPCGDDRSVHSGDISFGRDEYYPVAVARTCPPTAAAGAVLRC